MRHALLLAILATSAAADGPPQGGPAQGPPPASVVVAPVEEREVQATRAFTGTVEPFRRATIGSEVEGKVLAFLVREGVRVEENAPIARLDTGILRIRLAAERAALAREQQELLELQNGSRPEELDEARARLASAEAALEYARWKYESATRLFADKTLSEDELQSARSVARGAEQLVIASRASLALLEKGPRAERIEQARGTVLEREERIRLLEDEIARHEVRAPFTGHVVEERTEVGEWIAKGGPVAVLLDLETVEVVVGVPEQNVAALRLGMEARIRLDSLPAESFAGAVEAIVASGDVRSRTFPVRIRLKNRTGEAGPLLKAGMLARVALPVGEVEKVLLVPQDAIVLGGPFPRVYVATTDPMRPGMTFAGPADVETGAAYDGFLQVRGALRAGDKVIVRGNERILFPMQPIAPAEGK